MTIKGWKAKFEPFGPWLPLDRAVAVVAAGAITVIVLVLLLGDRTAVAVRTFSWSDRVVSADDRAFILSFNRPVNRDRADASLTIEPFLPGKISWSGPRMAYTLEQPAPYGSEYTLSVDDLQATNPDGTTDADTPTAPPFKTAFRSRDRAFAYIGTQGDEAGRLVLYNLTQQDKRILTPADLVVNEFIPYPDRERILLAAVDRRQSAENAASAIPDQQLFSVTTGLRDRPSDGWFSRSPPEAGQLAMLLDNDTYQNLKFDLAPDGETIVVQRASRTNPGEFGLWLLRDGQDPTPLDSEPGGDFRITPDSQALAMTQGEGVAIIAIPDDDDRDDGGRATDRAIDTIDFLPKFGSLLDFTADGTKAAMVQFNPDFTRALYVVTNQGQQIELGRLSGSILAAEFSPDGKTLFGLLTQLLDGETYREQPYLAAIDIDAKSITPLLILPEQPDISLDLAPDGLALLFDRIVAAETPDAPNQDGPITKGGAPIEDSQLWLLPIARDESGQVQAIDPQELPLRGLRPQWMP